MEASSISNEVITEFSETQSDVGQHNVDVLGQPPTESSPSVHPKSDWSALRPSGKVTTNNVLRLLEFQKHRCALTGRKLEPETASLDHVVPVRSGGAHAIENTQVLHRDVNRAKSTMTNEEFIQLCCEVAKQASLQSLHGTAQAL